MSGTQAPLPPASPRPFQQVPSTPGSPRSLYPLPTPGSPRSQMAHSPRTPLSPSFRAPLSPRTPLSQRRPSPPGGLYPTVEEPTTPHGFVPMRRDSVMTYNPKTPMSATFQQEEAVRVAEEDVTKIDRGDLKVKLRVRIAKVVLRGVNFCCSLVVLSLIASAMYIFHKTQNLPQRNGLPPWAEGSATWPQITLICIAAVSLLLSMAVLFAYWRGGHRRAEKASVYWTVFSIAAFIFAIVMWGIAAGILNGTRAVGEGKDIWGWACKDNKRRALFEEDIDYVLVCRELDWGFICALIEVSVELFTIGIYAFAFWRLASKRRLRKSMDVRDKARSELWLAKLREQEAGGSDSEDDEKTKANTAFNAASSDPYSAAEEGRGETMATPTSAQFKLQAPPRKIQHQVPVTLTPTFPTSGWTQANSYDPTSVPLPPTPAYAPSSYTNRQSIPPTPASVRFNLTPSPPPSRE